MQKQGTIYSNFKEIVSRNQNKTALAFLEKGKYQEINYQDLNDYVLKIVNYFLSLDLKKGDRVAILSENRWEWATVDLACNYLGLILVPIHTTYSSKYIDYIIQETSPRIIFISNQNLFNNFKKINPSLISNLEDIVLLEDDASGSLKIRYWKNIIVQYKPECFQKYVLESKVPMTIIYTSGTTGMPKGVILTNYNIISNIQNVLKYVPIFSKDRFFSFLPLSHILERTAGQMVPLFVGASIYYSRSPKTLIEDIKKAEPTILISVPRIFERVFDKIHDNLRNSSKLKHYLFYQALRVASKTHSLERKNEHIDKILSLKKFLFAQLVFKKIQNIFGGRLRLAISGGSSLDKRIARFFEDIGIKIVEGYGLTETSPIIAVNKVNNYKFGTVGHVLPNLDLKINEEKEILVKGASVFSAYWQEEKSTKNAFTEDWFHTGDLGFIDKDGFLNIIGRKKEIIVLSTGKNVVPGNIEIALNYDRFITQSMVIGAHRKFITALIVPDFEELEMYCQENDIKCSKDRECLNKEEIYRLYRNRIYKSLKGLAEYEQVVNFYLVPREFDQEHDELTPTLKLKRDNVEFNFKDIINKLYRK